ncbi:Major facilitator superfamily domain- general substrate transporter [Apiospora phragmitis]|uniref:Major facilitator superfamily domain- general substrate transporter n=1 Tax=Apiospora phragmitis TaxID=2905665 RepID=A0ABR1WU87_9PEZI
MKVFSERTSGQAGSTRWFGFSGGWLTFWITVSGSLPQVACMIVTDPSSDPRSPAQLIGVFSGVAITEDYLTVHGLYGRGKTELLSIITPIYAVGCFVGAVVALSVGEQLGRKKSVILGSVVMSVGAILQITSFSAPHMLVGRVVSGVGNGINTATAPVWQTETSQAKWRGKLVVLEMMMNIFGFMLVNWINYGMSSVAGPVAWRLPLALQSVFLLVLFATVPWLPESPRWLIAHGRADEATTILADLENKSVDDPYVIAARDEIVYSVQYERENAVRWRDLLRGRGDGGTKTVRRLLLGIGSQAMQQFGGINIMSYYLPTLLIESVGLTDSMARLIAALSSVSYLAASGIAAPLVERYGRRPMIIVSTAIQFFCFLMITILLYHSSGKPGYAGQQEAAKASVINSLPMRTKGAAAATMSNWITNFCVVEVTPIGLQTLGWRFYIVWTVLNAAFIPVLWLFFPETADRTLEDLDIYYRENPSLIVIRDANAISRRRPLKYVEMQERDIQNAALHESKGTGVLEHQD